MSLINQFSSAYIWHHSADADFAKKLAVDLQTSGFEVQYNDPRNTNGDILFHSVEWQLARIDIVIFLLSGYSVNASPIKEDIKKVLRQDGIVLVPVIIDDVGEKNIPILLKFIKPIDFRQPYDNALMLLVNGARDGPDSYYYFRKGRNSVFANPIVWMSGHFRRYLTLPPLTFCWQITVENLIISLTVTGLILLFFQPSTRTNLENISASQFFWLVIIISPIIETIILQVLPVFLAKRLGIRFFGQIVFSVIPFAVLHFSRSLGTGIGAGIIGGFYSAFTYVHWRQKSLGTALWVTALSHGLYNFAIFAMMIGEF